MVFRKVCFPDRWVLLAPRLDCPFYLPDQMGLGCMSLVFPWALVFHVRVLVFPGVLGVLGVLEDHVRELVFLAVLGVLCVLVDHVVLGLVHLLGQTMTPSVEAVQQLLLGTSFEMLLLEYHGRKQTDSCQFQ